MNRKFILELSFFSRTCEHIEPGMKSFVVSNDEAREKDDNNREGQRQRERERERDRQAGKQVGR